MVRRIGAGALVALVGLCWPGLVQAQYVSELVGFNGPPIDDPATSQEMFRIPEWNTTSLQNINTNAAGVYNSNAAYRAADGFQTEGDASLQVFFNWKDLEGNDPYAWVRLTTFGGADRPNPALQTQGRVRFKLTNVGDIFGGTGEIGLCLGVRETGLDVPQLANGGATGPIEWVGVSTTLSVIDCGTNGCASTVALDDIFSTNGEQEWISWGPNRALNSTAAGDDVARYGFIADTNGVRLPVPALQLLPTPLARDVEFDLLNGKVRVDGGAWVGGVAAFTGDGVLNAPSNRGTLEHLAIAPGLTQPGQYTLFNIDEMEFEAPVADPVPPPRVVFPIIADDPTVTVTDLVFNVAEVILYEGDPPQLVSSHPVITNDDLVITLPALAQAGEVYRAKQRSNVASGSVLSDYSSPVTVAAEPPVVTFSLLVDQGGTGSCNYTYGWEWVGVTAPVSGYAPQGQPLFALDGQWQTIDVPFDDDAMVEASAFSGNGILEPAPNGVYTMDSLWFTLWNVATNGPWEVFVDSVQVLDSNGVPAEVVLNMEDGVNRLLNPRGQSPDSPTSSALSTVTSYDGNNSHRFLWTYNATEPQSLGMLQRINYVCATSALIPDDAQGVRFHLLCRNQPQNPGVPLPQVMAPVVGQQQTVRVLHDAAATTIELFINGVGQGAVTPESATQTDFTGLTLQLDDSISARLTTAARAVSDLAYPRAAAPPVPPSLVSSILPDATNVTVSTCMTATFATASTVTVYADTGTGLEAKGSAPGGTATVVVPTSALPTGTVVYATQTVNNAESDYSNGMTVGAPPAVPVVNYPMEAGDATVRVTGVDPSAALVLVYANTTLLLGSIDPQGQTAVDVPVDPPLVHLDLISAAARNSLGNQSAHSPQLEVGRGNGNVLITMGIRETGGSGPVGANGGISPGVIEWVGASSAVNGAPQGYSRMPMNSWQSVTFDPVAGPVMNFVGGNGVINGTWGTIEHLAIAVDRTPTGAAGRSVGSYEIYIDNVENIGVGMVENFDSYADGTQVMFRQPTFSGSTNMDLLTSPNVSAVSSAQGNPGKSAQLRWHFVDSQDQRWVRLTTYQAPNRPNPLVRLDSPVKFDILILETLPPPAPTVNSPLVDGDTDVLVTDIDAEATLVTVYADGAPVGSINPAGTNGLAVPVTALQHLQRITARQTTPDGTSGDSTPLEVGDGNGVAMIALIIRETGDTGPIGSPGTATGQFELIGATSLGAGGAPQGQPLSLLNGWQTFVFDPVAGPITAWGSLDNAGDGQITATRGVLDALAITVDSASPDRSSGIYRLYVDNVVNGTAGLITDFEGYDPDAEVLFQEPTFSGSTDENLSYPPSASANTTEYANGGVASQLLTWFFRDTDASRWVRITAAQTANKPYPIIDLTQPISVDVLLLAGCPVLGDANGDCIIGLADFAVLQPCLFGPEVSVGAGCVCADLDGDRDVDLADFGAFQNAFTGTTPVPGCTP